MKNCLECEQEMHSSAGEMKCEQRTNAQRYKQTDRNRARKERTNRYRMAQRRRQTKWLNGNVLTSGLSMICWFFYTKLKSIDWKEHKEVTQKLLSTNYEIDSFDWLNGERDAISVSLRFFCPDGIVCNWLVLCVTTTYAFWLYECLESRARHAPIWYHHCHHPPYLRCDDIKSKLNCAAVRRGNLMPANKIWLGSSGKCNRNEGEINGETRNVIEITATGFCDCEKLTGKKQTEDGTMVQIPSVFRALCQHAAVTCCFWRTPM